MSALVGLGATGLAAAVVLAVAACYVRGLVRMRRHRGGRAHLGRPWALVTAVVIALVVTAPPLGELLEKRLATHMTQHMILIAVSAPLLAISGCGLPFLVGLPRAVRRPLTRLEHRAPVAGIVGPHAGWGIFVAALWLWHLPAAYDEAVRSPFAHEAEHACFLLTAWLFWWHVLGPTRRRLSGPAAALYLVAAIPPGAALGALLTFASHPIYPPQAREAAASGANPLTDQRVAGLVMWVPLDFLYVALAVVLIARWLRTLQQRWPEPTYGAFDDLAVDGVGAGDSLRSAP